MLPSLLSVLLAGNGNVVVMSTAAWHSQQQQQQQEEAQPCGLEDLPAPALRRVLQLASTPHTPGICRVSRVSKALRVAADAAAAPIRLTIPLDRYTTSFYLGTEPIARWDKVTARYARLGAWLRCHGPCIHGLHIVSELDKPMLDWVMVEDLAYGIPAAAAAAAGRGVEDVSQAEVAAAAAAAELAAAGLMPRGTTTPAHAIGRLHLGVIRSCGAWFEQLQVLVVTGYIRSFDGSYYIIKQVLPRLTQLQRLAIHRYSAEEDGTANELLMSLPASLRALDLGVGGSGPCHRRSLEHLVHLTSLKLDCVDIVGGSAADPFEQEEQQQEEHVGVSGSLAPSAQTTQQQQQRWQRTFLPSLRALSMRPLHEGCWFAGPALEQVELVFDCLPTPSLDQLAGCRHLRQLTVGHYFQVRQVTGVSLLTQLTRLRLKGLKTIHSSSSLPPLGTELGALEQLQVLELSYGCVQAMQPRNWLPRLHCLKQLVVLSMDPDQLEPLQHLADVITEWHASSSSSGGDGSGGNSSASKVSATSTLAATTPASSSKAERSTPPAGTACALQQLVLTSPSPEQPPPESRQAVALSELQQAAADLSAAHPWLQVVVSDTDGYISPCWVGAQEKM
jgi:hypothetical protein